MVVFTIEMDYPSETDNPSYKSTKIEGKKTGKVRWNICPMLNPFHFHMKTGYPIDTNYPTDITSQTDNVSSVKCENGQ